MSISNPTPCGIVYHSCKEKHNPDDSICNHMRHYHFEYCLEKKIKGECPEKNKT